MEVRLTPEVEADLARIALHKGKSAEEVALDAILDDGAQRRRPEKTQ